MIEFEINTHKYKTSKMGVMTQWAIARRIAPVVAHIMTPDLLKSFMSLKGTDEGTDPGKMMELFSGIFNPLAYALSQMNDEDNEYVINHCLAVVYRQSGGGWTIIKPLGSGLMFEADIDLLEMMQIVVRVIVDTVGNFSFASLSNLFLKVQE